MRSQSKTNNSVVNCIAAATDTSANIANAVAATNVTNTTTTSYNNGTNHNSNGAVLHNFNVPPPMENKKSTSYPTINAAYWLPAPNPTPYQIPGSFVTHFLSFLACPSKILLLHLGRV